MIAYFNETHACNASLNYIIICRFNKDWLKDESLRDSRYVQEATDLTKQEKECIMGIHKRHAGLAENPSVTDLIVLGKAYGKKPYPPLQYCKN